MSASETINTGREKLDAWLQEKNFFTDVLEKVEKKTGVKKIYLFLGNNVYAIQWTLLFSVVYPEVVLSTISGLVGIFALYLVFGYGADLIVTVLGFAYPAYQS